MLTGAIVKVLIYTIVVRVCRFIFWTHYHPLTTVFNQNLVGLSANRKVKTT